MSAALYSEAELGAHGILDAADDRTRNSCPPLGVKRTSHADLSMSAFDPKRTFSSRGLGYRPPASETIALSVSFPTYATLQPIQTLANERRILT